MERQVEGFAGTNGISRNLQLERTEVEGSDGGPGAKGNVISNLVEA